MDHPKIAILIPCKDIDTFLMQSVKECLNLNYTNYYLILLPDKKINLPFKLDKIIVIPTGITSAARKRNIGVRNCQKDTEYFAFIDSDAYPDSNWLINAVKYFCNNNIILAVGGPNLTPKDESFKRRVTGYIYEQNIGFGSGAYRHRRSKTRYVGELPTCNIIVRKDLFDFTCFNEDFLAAEDNKLCNDIMKLGFNILFAEDVVVMHHRRKIFLPMMKQAYYYGYFRAKLIKHTCQCQTKVFLPFLLFLYVLFNLSCFIIGQKYFLLSFIPLCFYFVYVFINCCFYIQKLIPGIIATIAIALCHLSYGYGFMVFYQKLLFAFDIRELKFSKIEKVIYIGVNE